MGQCCSYIPELESKIPATNSINFNKKNLNDLVLNPIEKVEKFENININLSSDSSDIEELKQILDDIIPKSKKKNK